MGVHSSFVSSLLSVAAVAADVASAADGAATPDVGRCRVIAAAAAAVVVVAAAARAVPPTIFLMSTCSRAETFPPLWAHGLWIGKGPEVRNRFISC